MALIKCKECGKEVSDKATACPNCGFPIAENEDNSNEEKIISNNVNDKNTKTKESKHIFAWIVCVVTIISAFANIDNFAPLIMRLVAGIFVCPEFIKYIKNKKGKEIAPLVQILVWIICIVIAANTTKSSEININNSNFSENIIMEKNITNEYDEEKVVKTDEELRNEFIKECESYTYKEIARNPQSYIGKEMKFTGKVVQASESRGLINDITSVTLLIAVTKNDYGLGDEYAYYEDNIYCTYTYAKNESKILEDDIITIYGTCKGDYTYTSVLGASITVPKVELKYYEIK